MGIDRLERRPGEETSPLANGAGVSGSLGEPAETAALYRFTDRLFRAASQHDVYQAGLDAIVEAMGCRRASILRFDRDHVMRFVAWRGLSEAYRKAVDGHTPWREGALNATPVVIADIQESDESDAIKAIIRAENIRSLAFVPLTAAGAVVGKFMIYFAERHEFTARELDLAMIIARQLSFSLERLAAEEELKAERENQQLLLREMDHRIRNLFTIVSAMIVLSARDADDPRQLSEALQGRLGALARAHALTFAGVRTATGSRTTLHALIRAILEPYDPSENGGDRVRMAGDDVDLRGDAAAAFAVLLYEMATNAAKYGSLSMSQGGVEIRTERRGGRLYLLWSEHGGPAPTETRTEGFGSKLAKQTAERQLGGQFSVRWRPAGLVIRLSALLKRIEPRLVDEGVSMLPQPSGRS